MAGWADLGRVLAGGVDTEGAYQRGMSRAAQAEGLLADARMKNLMAQRQVELPGALTKLGMPSDLATVLQGGYDPKQVSGYMGDMQLQDIRSRALDAPDWDSRNALLAVLEGKPVQLATVQGQNLINNQYLTGGGGISTTEQGRASIRQSDASA